MKYSWVFILLVVIAVGIIFGAFANPFVTLNNQNSNTPSVAPVMKAASHSAYFAIFTNGTFRVFTDPRYHNLSPDVFLEPPQVNTIRVKKDGITYQNFFNTLPMKLDKNCLTTGTNQTFCTGERNKLRFFINGKEDPNTLDKIILPNDKLLVTFGNLTDTQINSQIERVPSK